MFFSSVVSTILFLVPAFLRVWPQLSAITARLALGQGFVGRRGFAVPENSKHAHFKAWRFNTQPKFTQGHFLFERCVACAPSSRRSMPHKRCDGNPVVVSSFHVDIHRSRSWGASSSRKQPTFNTQLNPRNNAPLPTQTHCSNVSSLEAAVGSHQSPKSMPSARDKRPRMGFG